MFAKVLCGNGRCKGDCPNQHLQLWQTQPMLARHLRQQQHQCELVKQEESQQSQDVLEQARNGAFTHSSQQGGF